MVVANSISELLDGTVLSYTIMKTTEVQHRNNVVHEDWLLSVTVIYVLYLNLGDVLREEPICSSVQDRNFSCETCIQIVMVR